MRALIDRTRWPVLITYSDEGQGHTGHVYKCSGWRATMRARRPVRETADGRRASLYSNGKCGARDLKVVAATWLQRWESWACSPGSVAAWMTAAGWQRVPVPG